MFGNMVAGALAAVAVAALAIVAAATSGSIPTGGISKLIEIARPALGPTEAVTMLGSPAVAHGIADEQAKVA